MTDPFKFPHSEARFSLCFYVPFTARVALAICCLLLKETLEAPLCDSNIHWLFAQPSNLGERLRLPFN